MAITLESVSVLVMRATRFIEAFVHWSSGTGTNLSLEGTTQIKLRSYQTHLQAFIVEATAITESEGFLSMGITIQTDCAVIADALTSTVAAITAAIDASTIFTALDSDRKDELATAYGMTGDPDDAFAALSPERQLDVVQHEAIDSAAITDIVESVSIA